jgi:hypothetical protein
VKAKLAIVLVDDVRDVLKEALGLEVDLGHVPGPPAEARLHTAALS